MFMHNSRCIAVKLILGKIAALQTRLVRVIEGHTMYRTALAAGRSTARHNLTTLISCEIVSPSWISRENSSPSLSESPRAVLSGDVRIPTARGRRWRRPAKAVQTGSAMLIGAVTSGVVGPIASRTTSMNQFCAVAATGTKTRKTPVKSDAGSQVFTRDRRCKGIKAIPGEAGRFQILKVRVIKGGNMQRRQRTTLAAERRTTICCPTTATITRESSSQSLSESVPTVLMSDDMWMPISTPKLRRSLPNTVDIGGAMLIGVALSQTVGPMTDGTAVINWIGEAIPEAAGARIRGSDTGNRMVTRDSWYKGVKTILGQETALETLKDRVFHGRELPPATVARTHYPTTPGTSHENLRRSQTESARTILISDIVWTQEVRLRRHPTGTHVVQAGGVIGVTMIGVVGRMVFERCVMSELSVGTTGVRTHGSDVGDRTFTRSRCNEVQTIVWGG